MPFSGKFLTFQYLTQKKWTIIILCPWFLRFCKHIKGIKLWVFGNQIIQCWSNVVLRINEIGPSDVICQKTKQKRQPSKHSFFGFNVNYQFNRKQRKPNSVPIRQKQHIMFTDQILRPPLFLSQLPIRIDFPLRPPSLFLIKLSNRVIHNKHPNNDSVENLVINCERRTWNTGGSFGVENY